MSGLSMLRRGLCFDHEAPEDEMLTGLAAFRFFCEWQPSEGARNVEDDEVRDWSSAWQAASQGVAGGLLPHEGLLALADLLALEKALANRCGASIMGQPCEPA